jgi:hypothetical protein
MATTTRQTAIFGVEDWKQIYQTYREADFQSYDFETLRKSFVDYLRLYYPETFNDYIESVNLLPVGCHGLYGSSPGFSHRFKHT